jgi:hypothetical protein
LINLKGKLIVAVNQSDKMLRRIVKVERPPIEGAIWTAVIEVVGAPAERRTYEDFYRIQNPNNPSISEYGSNSVVGLKALSLIVIPFDSLVKGYRLVEAMKEDR